MVTTGRTGSNFLCAFLDHVPGVVCHREVFHERRPHLAFEASSELAPKDSARRCDPLPYLAQLEDLTVKRVPDAHAVGFKLFPVHSEIVLRHVVGDPDYRMIVSRRENVLAQYSSDVLARTAGRWWLPAGQPRTGIRIRFNERNFLAYLRSTMGEYQRVSDLLESASKPALAVEYVEMKQHDVLEALLGFIGAEPRVRLDAIVSKVKMQKQHSSRDRRPLFESGRCRQVDEGAWKGRLARGGPRALARVRGRT